MIPPNCTRFTIHTQRAQTNPSEVFERFLESFDRFRSSWNTSAMTKCAFKFCNFLGQRIHKNTLCACLTREPRKDISHIFCEPAPAQTSRKRFGFGSDLKEKGFGLCRVPEKQFPHPEFGKHPACD